MKTDNAESTELTASAKKLKQARLPFKLLSDIGTSPPTPQSRKRKLSTSENETVTKVGRMSKENEVTGDPVVISDDDSKSDEKPQEEPKHMNPYVKLVDNIRKKKFQKSKINRKRHNSKTKSNILTNSSLESTDGLNCDDEIVKSEDIEMKDVTVSEISDAKESADNDKLVVSHQSNNDKLWKSKTNSEVKRNNQMESDRLKDNAIEKCEANSDLELKKQYDVNRSKDEASMSETLHDTYTMENKSRSENVCSEANVIIEYSEQTEKDNTAVSVTPKQSVLIKEVNNTVLSPKVDDNIRCNSSSPDGNSTSLSNSLSDSLSEKNGSATLTPKQLQKKMESAKRREEKEKERQEREKKRQIEKEERSKQKREKEEQRRREREEKEEAKRKEKEEKDELRRKEKEEKDRQKELEKKLREEKEELKRKEKEEKEEQRKKEKEAKDEEKRKKHEAVEQEKQELELKKKKAAEAFVNFFVPKQKVETDQPGVGSLSKNEMLSSFTIKSDMRLAPTIRVKLSEERKKDMEGKIKGQNIPNCSLYLENLKKETTKPVSSGKTWPLSDKDEDDDCMIIEDELPPVGSIGEILTCNASIREKLRPKLLSFHENRRPPYWGTWRKESAIIKPRRPFGQDEKQLYYEVDSDDEWEEEQEGESIDGSAAGSEDEQDADEYEVDNEVFVPHGYLSDEEATMEEDEDVLSSTPETQKARLKYLEDEFESELKKPTEKLKPRLYGLIWETKMGGKPDNCIDALWKYFGKLSAIINDPTPLLQPSNDTEDSEKKKVKKKKLSVEEQSTHKSDKKKKVKTDEKESSKVKVETNKGTPEVKKNQPAINTFLSKLKSK